MFPLNIPNRTVLIFFQELKLDIDNAKIPFDLIYQIGMQCFHLKQRSVLLSQFKVIF